MARKCDICGKKTITGNNVSHAHNTSRRVWKPNLVRMKARVGGQVKTIRVCTSCLRSNKVEKVI